MQNKLPKERIIYDNYDLSDNYSDEDIIEMLIENGIFTEDERDEITDHNIWEERYFLDECDWEEAKVVLNKYFNNANKLICVGSVGRWNGIFSGGFIFDTLDELMNKATEDCYYWKFYDENGHLFLHCSHHDGSCSFEIKELTDRGYEYYENWNYNWEDQRPDSYIFEQLMSRYSRLLRIAEREWGCSKREYVSVTKENIINKLNNEARSFYC